MAEKGNSPVPSRDTLMADIGTSPLLLKGLLQLFRSMRVALPRERRPKPLLSLPPTLTSERIRILHEYSWRGAPGGGRRTRIVSPPYCYISGHQCKCRVAHSVLKHRLGATSVVTFITKRAALVGSRRSVRSFCGRRLGGGPSAAEVARLGWVLGAACDAGYGLPRIRLPRTPVNRHIKWDRGSPPNSLPDHLTTLSVRVRCPFSPPLCGRGRRLPPVPRAPSNSSRRARA